MVDIERRLSVEITKKLSQIAKGPRPAELHVDVIWVYFNQMNDPLSDGAFGNSSKSGFFLKMVSADTKEPLHENQIPSATNDVIHSKKWLISHDRRWSEPMVRRNLDQFSAAAADAVACSLYGAHCP